MEVFWEANGNPLGSKSKGILCMQSLYVQLKVNQKRNNFQTNNISDGRNFKKLN